MKTIAFLFVMTMSSACYARCATDDDCSAGQICQCSRRFDPVFARCDEMLGSCGVPSSATESRDRTAVRAAAKLRLQKMKLIPSPAPIGN